MKRLEQRTPIKLYKKVDICRTEWITEWEFGYHIHEFLPVRLETSTTRQSKDWYTIRYVKKKDIQDFLLRN